MEVYDKRMYIFVVLNRSEKGLPKDQDGKCILNQYI